MATCILLAWFEQRRKSKTLRLAQKQIEMAIRTVTKLKEAIIAFSEGKSEEIEERIETLFLDEMEIDDLRRQVFEELTSEALSSQYREDLMHMVKRLDVMADHVKDSARNVKILMNRKVPKEIWNTIMRIAETLVKGAGLLRTTIETLGINPLETIELSKRIEEQENIVDDEYLKAKALFFKYTDKLDFAVMIVLKDLLESMEQIADTCADTADYIRVLAVGK